MKTKLTILIIFLISGVWSFGQPLRPPVKTNELELIDKLTWQNDVIGKDSLVYFIQISPTCYKYRSLETASVWDTICFSPTSSVYVIIGADTIILVDGGTFVRNDSTFQLRRDPFCNQCWEYKYSTWVNWDLFYCEQVANGQFLIAKNLQDFFWMYRADNGLDWVDSLKAVVNLQDTNKIMTMTKDSVWKWLPPVDQHDSAYFVNIGWIANKDTVPDKTDSLFLYNGRYYNRKDELIISNNIDTVYSTLTITDTIYSQILRVDTIYSQISRVDTVYSQISRVDTIYSTIIKTDTIVLNGEGFADEKVKIAYSTGSKGAAGYLSEDDFTLQSVGGVNRFRIIRDSLWVSDTYGITEKDTTKNVGIGTPSVSYAKLIVNDDNIAIRGDASGFGIGVQGISDDGYGVSGQSTNGYGVYATSIDSFGLYGYSIGDVGIRGVSANYYSGEFSGGLGLKADSLSLNSGVKVGRIGTMATYDKWTGTQAEWNANTPKDGVYPQASTTHWEIKD